MLEPRPGSGEVSGGLVPPGFCLVFITWPRAQPLGSGWTDIMGIISPEGQGVGVKGGGLGEDTGSPTAPRVMTALRVL